MARIDYADPEDLPPDKRSLLDTLADETDEPSDPEDGAAATGTGDPDGGIDHRLQGGTLNVYRALGRNPVLLEAFRAYGSAVWSESGLSAHERETVILATAVHADSAYEWQQHVRVALDEGMDPDRIVAVSRGDTDRLPPAHAAIVEYVAAFVDGRVGDDRHAALADHYDAERIVGIALLAGCYLGLARVLQAFEVDLESAFVGWELSEL